MKTSVTPSPSKSPGQVADRIRTEAIPARVELGYVLGYGLLLGMAPVLKPLNLTAVFMCHGRALLSRKSVMPDTDQARLWLWLESLQDSEPKKSSGGARASV